MPSYKLNWPASNCLYDLLLGKPWHVANNPEIKYKKRVISVDGKNINKSNIESCGNVEVIKMSVKEFRKLLKEKRSNIQAYQIVSKNNEYKDNVSATEKLLSSL